MAVRFIVHCVRGKRGYRCRLAECKEELLHLEIDACFLVIN